jgi:6-phosphogluconolactonase (cycloisomerase 2 family)
MAVEQVRAWRIKPNDRILAGTDWWQVFEVKVNGSTRTFVTRKKFGGGEPREFTFQSDEYVARAGTASTWRRNTRRW